MCPERPTQTPVLGMLTVQTEIKQKQLSLVWLDGAGEQFCVVGSAEKPLKHQAAPGLVVTEVNKTLTRRSHP